MKLKPKTMKLNNFVVRTLAGAVYLAIMLAAFLTNEYVFAGVAIIFTAGMVNEFCLLGKDSVTLPVRILSVTAAVCLFLLVFAYGVWGMPAKYIAALILPLICIVLSCIVDPARNQMNGIARSLAGLLYIAVPMSLSTLLVLRSGSFDGRVLLAFFIMIWGSDIGAYCIGTLFGQKETSRKLCPSVSPHKSWAGFWGGLCTAVVAGIVLSNTVLLPVSIWHAAGLAVTIHLAGTLGDLFESRWKRDAGVKDSGNVIPGHGGLLDRLDSSLLAVPAACAYLILTNLW